VLTRSCNCPTANETAKQLLTSLEMQPKAFMTGVTSYNTADARVLQVPHALILTQPTQPLPFFYY
jgi:hypothetical protein